MKPFLKKILFIAILFPTLAFSLTWDLTTLDNKKKSIGDYKEKWVIVNFWATWCPPCREEIPELSSFHENNAKRAVVLGVNHEDVSDKKLKTFIDEYFMEYPQFKMSPYDASPLGRIEGLPTTFVITPSGEVVAKQVGGVTEEMLTNFIDNWKK